MNKRGFIQDGMFFIVMLFVLAIFSVIAYVALDLINDAFQAEDSISDSSKAHVDDLTTKFPSMMDWTFILILIGITVAGIVVSYIVPANPLIFFFMIFIVIILGGVAGYISNAWEDSTDGDGVIATASTNFPMTTFVMDNYLLFMVVIILMMGVVFYAKPEGAF